MLLQELNWRAVDALDRTLPIIIPIAAVEQHGHHLPVYTDSFLLGEVVRRAEAELGDRALVTPLQWLGNSEHHLDFPGTMIAAPRVYLDLLKDFVSNFLFHGFQRILLLNGHGGNIVPSQQAIFELRQERRERKDLLLLAATYWTLGEQGGDDFVQSQMGHACEWETSMMLCIRPDLVGRYQEIPEQPFGDAFAPAARGWVTKDRSPMGHIGTPAAASAEKGEVLLQSFSAGVVTLVEGISAWDGVSWDG